MPDFGADRIGIYPMGTLSHSHLDDLLRTRNQFEFGELWFCSGLCADRLEPGESAYDKETSSDI
jgi:hypothetical protein